MRKHLNALHKKEFELVLKTEKERKQQKDDKEKTKKRKDDDDVQGNSKKKQLKLADFSDRFIKYSATSDKQKEFDQAMVDFLADTFVPFNVVGQDSFKKLFDIANKRLTVKNPTTYSRMITDTAENTLAKVCQIIAREKTNILSVGITTDLWTSRGGDSYMSLTVSWIDPMWRMIRFTPFVHPFPGRHTGDRISVELDGMIEELKFDRGTDKVCVSDNASNMKVALRQSQYLREYFCDIHTIQLGIEDTFKNVVGMAAVLDKSKHIAKFCHQSTVAMDQLRSAANQNGIDFRKPQNPNKTRWDSQFDTMVSILHLKAAIEDLETSEPVWEEKALSRSEWKLLEGAVRLLKPFKETTKIWQYESIPTINLVIDRIYCMEEFLADFIANRNNDKFGVMFAKELQKNLGKRFPNHGLGVFERRVANYLDPHFKGIHLRKFKQFESTKDEIETFIGEEMDDPIDLTDGERNNNVESLTDGNMSPTSKLRFELAVLQPTEREDTKMKKELALFDKFEVAPKEENVLHWWKEHEKTLPNLAKFARRILAIPVSSGKSERVFSTGGNFVTAKRTRLNSRKVQSLIIIKENKRQLQLYLSSLGEDKLGPVDGEEAFKRIIVVETVGILADDEFSSDDEYFLDDD